MRHTLMSLRRQLAEAHWARRYIARDMLETVTKLVAERDEHRARRLEIEGEIDAMADLMIRTEPVVRYVERKIYNPMPPRVVTKRTTILKHVPGPERIVERLVEVPVPVYTPRPAGFFGRLGDWVDSSLGS